MPGASGEDEVSLRVRLVEKLEGLVIDYCLPYFMKPPKSSSIWSYEAPRP